MRITVPHYFDFGSDRELVGDDLVRPEAWDAIRTESDGPFAMPATREAWEALADEHPILEQRARRIDSVLSERGAQSSTLASYGVGGASLECWLARVRPERPLIVSEYAPATVKRLGEVFTEADVRQTDLLADPPLEADWHLFHRIDTEFSNGDWRAIFDRFANSKVLLVASELVDWRRAVSELLVGLRNRNATRSGRIRNRAAFEALWKHTHDAEPVEIADVHGWALTPKSRAG
jgi:hypothetical protein